MKKVLPEISISDTEIPAYNGELYESKEAVFLIKANGNQYCYTLLSSKEDPKEASEMILNINYVQGIHLWLYEGSSIAVSVDDELPDTTGLTIPLKENDLGTYSGRTETEYRLRAYAKLYFGDVDSIARYVSGWNKINTTSIARYDYNLNKTLDEEDLKISIKYLTSKLNNLLWLNEYAVDRYVEKYMQLLNHENVEIHRTDSSGPVVYAFNVSTGDLSYDYLGGSYCSVVQCLPTSYIDAVSQYVDENADVTDESADLIAYDPHWKYWAKVMDNSPNWWFSAGYYVYVLDENGNYVLDWIK